MPSPLVTARDPELSSDDELRPEDDPSLACFVLHSGGSKLPMGNAVALERSRSKSAKASTAKRDILPMPPCLKDEPTDCGLQRMEAFRTIWGNIETSIKDIFELHNTKNFQEIQKFIRDTLFCDAQLNLYLSAKAAHASSTGLNRRVNKQLHAALIYLRNVDSSDHTTTFNELRNYLRKNECHVASLFPHNFSSKIGVDGPLYSMIKQIAKINPDTTDLDILVFWHRDAAHIKHPIAVIIEDAELCSSMVLADFIVILSEWISELPIVLIMGMATSGDAVRKLLPASAVRHLHVHSFTLPWPDEYLNGIIKAVLVTPFISFNLGFDLLKFLLSYFRKYDSTVTVFLRALKMACMEHFFSQPLSFLCTKLLESHDQAHLEDFCKSLPETLLQYAATLSSVQSMHFEDGHDIGKGMALALANLRKHKQNWSIALECLLAAGELLGMDSVEVLSKILQQRTQNVYSIDSGAGEDVVFDGTGFEIVHSENVNAINSLLRKMREAPVSTLLRVLSKWESLTENLSELKIEVQALLHKVTSEIQIENKMGSFSSTCNGSFRRKMLLSSVNENLDEQQITPCNLTSNAKTSEGDVESAPDDLIEGTTMHLESDHLYTRVAVGNPTSFKKVCSKVHNKMAADMLQGIIRQYLTPLESLPFNEITCFGNVAAINKTLLGEFRISIQRNVQYTRETLECECCSLKNGTVSTSQNDSSILYNLAQKQGDQISVYDLFQSFEAVICDPDIDHHQKGSKKRKKTLQHDLDRVSIQARFCKAASELQLVGLFRMPSKKRSEFVQLAVV